MEKHQRHTDKPALTQAAFQSFGRYGYSSRLQITFESRRNVSNLSAFHTHMDTG